jgi:hypothetical protein
MVRSFSDGALHDLKPGRPRKPTQSLCLYSLVRPHMNRDTGLAHQRGVWRRNPGLIRAIGQAI